MKVKVIIDEKVIFIPDENKLSLLGARGTEVIMNTPVSRFLFLLLEKNGKVVTHEEIFREVWERHGQMVSLNTLYQNVSLLRKSLKKTGLITSSIRTHPKVGFSFRGKVQIIEPDTASFQVHDSPSVSADNADSDLPPHYSSEPDSVMAVNPAAALTLSTPHRKVYSLLFIILVGIFITALIVWFMAERAADKTFTIEHQVIARINDCPLYVDKGNRDVNIARIVTYLKEQGFSCNQKEFLYLTKILHQDELVLLSCSLPSDEPLGCVSSIKIPEYLYPK
ncbi:TPA: winged helix-turn-helix domain-containing protein [Klebsiella aerogenes]|nr:winged helix-turn-helix domain-containing protein [Klebsiella aerogenes]